MSPNESSDEGTIFDLRDEGVAEHIEMALAAYFRRCQHAQDIGGISLRDAVQGTDVPEGWVLDQETYYYLPPNVVLL